MAASDTLVTLIEKVVDRHGNDGFITGEVTEVNRDMFNFTRRDECVAFLLLLEFFERQLQEQAVSTEDKENLRFRFGSFLEFACARFREVFPERTAFYTDEQVRRTVRGIMPALHKYRFLREIPRGDEDVKDDDTIYECLPAMWLYKGERLARPVGESGTDATGEPGQ